MWTDLWTRVNSELGATAVLEGWDGTPPADIDDADAGSMIVNFSMANPVLLALSGDVASANPPSNDTDTGAGTVQYWRMKTGTGGNTIFQWTEGDDFVTDNPTFALHDECALSSLIFTFQALPDDH